MHALVQGCWRLDQRRSLLLLPLFFFLNFHYYHELQNNLCELVTRSRALLTHCSWNTSDLLLPPQPQCLTCGSHVLQVRLTTHQQDESFCKVQNQRQGDAKSRWFEETSPSISFTILGKRKRLTKKECMLLVGAGVGVSVNLYFSILLPLGGGRNVCDALQEKMKKHFPPLCSALLHIKETISGKRKTGLGGRKVLEPLFTKSSKNNHLLYIAYYTVVFLLQCERWEMLTGSGRVKLSLTLSGWLLSEPTLEHTGQAGLYTTRFFWFLTFFLLFFLTTCSCSECTMDEVG